MTIRKRRKLRVLFLLLLALVLFLSACSHGVSPRVPDLRRSSRVKADYGVDEKGRPSYPGAVRGVDVSNHQGEIDWARVKADGIDFAILRIGFRGNTQGALNLDESFARNYVQAREAGLQVGVYFYSQAISEDEAVQEADWILKTLDGVPLELPVFFDWEEAAQGRTGGKATNEVGAWALAFCKEITAGGYQAGVYFNQKYGYSIMRLQNLTDYCFWNAEYESWQSFGYETQIWQYTGRGEVDGIDIIVDMNLMYAPEEIE